MGLYQRAKWPDNTAELIRQFRNEGKTWEAIAVEFGCSLSAIRHKAVELGVMVKSQRRFTPEEDAFIRAEWAKNTHVNDIAAALKRDAGTVRQRVYHSLKDLVGTRDPSATRLVRRYGREILLQGGTPQEINARIKAVAAEAQSAARASVNARWLAKQKDAIAEMHAAIAAGGDRNEAIARCRDSGVKLERLGEEFGVTRERIRQICESVYVRRSIAAQEPKLKVVGE